MAPIVPRIKSNSLATLLSSTVEYVGPGVAQAQSPKGDSAPPRRECPPQGQGRGFSSGGRSLRSGVRRAGGVGFPRRASEGSRAEAGPRTRRAPAGPAELLPPRWASSPGLGGGLCSRGRPRLLAEGCSHETQRGVAEVAALGSQPERLVKGPGGLPQPSLNPAFSPLPQASAGASRKLAASSGAAGQRQAARRESGWQCWQWGCEVPALVVAEWP